MFFTFPYQYGFINKRRIPYPIVPIAIPTVLGDRSYAFIMDTGSDSMTLPRYMIQLLGLHQTKLRESTAQGVGETLVKTYETVIDISFCKQVFSVPCSFADNDRTPFLLGKDGIFKRFNITFDNDRQRTIFENRLKGS